MSNIGGMTITTKAKPGEVCGRGSLQTLHMGFNFDVLREEGKAGENKPALKFYANTPGGAAEIGTGWLKEKKGDDGKPREFYSITFDDPSFDAPLNVAAWPDAEHAGRFNIIFNRPRQKAERA